MYKTYIYTYTDEIGKKKKTKNKNHDAPAQSFSSYVAYMYISGRPSHFTAKRNIAFTIYHHPPRVFFKIQNPSSILPPFLEKEKKPFPTLRTIAILLSSTAIRAHCSFFSFLEYVRWLCRFFDLLCFIVVPASAREMIKEAMRSKGKKKEKKRYGFRRMETTLFENNGDRDDRLFRRFFYHRLVIVTATIILLRVRHRNDEQPLLRLSHIYIYIFFFFTFP